MLWRLAFGSIYSPVGSDSRMPCVRVCVHAQRFVFASVIIHDLQMEAEILSVAVQFFVCGLVLSCKTYISVY